MVSLKKSENFHSATIADARLLRGLLGLRGVAALAIVLTHVNYLTRIALPEGFGFIKSDFGYGAHLFFVLSAFSLLHSTEHTMARPNWIGDYLIKRLFRIAPLFYVVLSLMLVYYAYNSGAVFSMGIGPVFLNVFFLFGFFQATASSLVWGGWTIGVEMIFYLIFPIILLVIRTARQALALLIAVAVISYMARYQLHENYLQATPRPTLDMSFFMFVSNMYFFSIGIAAYRIAQKLTAENFASRVVMPLVAIGLIGVLMLTDIDEPLKGGGRFDLVLWAVGFGALVIWQSKRPTTLVASWFFEFIGERSYSIYLLNPIVIMLMKTYIIGMYLNLDIFGAYAFFICAIFVLALILIVAEFSYRFIEIPGIKFGRKLIGGKRDFSQSNA